MARKFLEVFLKNRIFPAAVLGLLALASAAFGRAPDSIAPGENVLGKANAPVTMIEYFSPACTACAEFAATVFPQIKAQYIDTGKVRYVMRLYPLFPIDGSAYKLERCVAPDRFFAAADLLFRRQKEWDNAEYRIADPHAGLIRAGQALGLTAKEADDCMNSKKLDDAINNASKDAEARYNPSDTPTFVINYVKDETGTGWEEIQAALNAALAAKRRH